MDYTIIAQAGEELRIRVDDAVYTRPVPAIDPTHPLTPRGTLFMSVEYDDGERFAFYTNEGDPVVKAFRSIGL